MLTVIKALGTLERAILFDVTAVPLKGWQLHVSSGQGCALDGAKDEEVIVEITGIGPGTTLPTKPEGGMFISTKK